MKVSNQTPIRIVRSGQGFQWAKEFAEEGLVGVDFDVFEDLSRFTALNTNAGPEWEAFKDLVAGYQPALQSGVDQARSVGVKAGSIARLVAVFQEGDVVLSPVHGSYLVGRIRGGYFWRPDLPANRPRHCRRVGWLGQITNKQLSAETRQALTSWNSVFSINPGGLAHADLVEVLRQLPDGRLPIDRSEGPRQAPDGQPDGLERIVAWDEERDRQVVFHGRWLTKWIDPYEDVHFYRVAQTKKGAIAVVDAEEGTTMAQTGEHAAQVLRVYEDLRAADKDGIPYPVILAAAEALGIEYADELDI